MPTAEEFRTELDRIFYEAFHNRQPTVDANAGDLHRRVGGYPSSNHRMPVCCEVMRSAMDSDAGDIVLSQPPKGNGPTLTIRYILPRQD
jgi:5-methylcytosine-specific restriction protein A